MPSNRKRRADSWDTALSEAQQAQIADRMRRFPWYEVSAWIHEQFSVPAPSRTALFRFRTWFADHEAEYLLRQRVNVRAGLERELAVAGAPDPAVLARVLGNDVAAARAHGDEAALERAVRLYQAVAHISGDSARLRLDAEKLQIETCEKFLAWYHDAKARDIADSAASNAEKIAALRKTFFADVDAMEASGKVNLPT